MATAARSNRQKISTTVAPETFAYLERLVSSGTADTLADAVDLVVGRLRAIETRERLERDTAAYFDEMPEEEAAEERRLAALLAGGARKVDVDREP